MDPGKSNTLSQIEEEMNFPLSKLHSTEIKESIRIFDSNILPQIKNSIEIKPPDSNFKQTYDKDKEIKVYDKNEQTNEKAIEKEKTNEEEKTKSNKEEEKTNEKEKKNINFDTMLIINNNKIPDEKSLTVSPNKEESKLISEKPEEEETKNLGKYLNFVIKNRKQVNLEAQILANRIALLKQEELKTLKKIKETKNKADDIYRLKKQNYERNLEVCSYFYKFLIFNIIFRGQIN
jgi:hypothetical protein